ncbi:MAG: hypothetical protein RR454_00665 [Clostridia bacterium]
MIENVITSILEAEKQAEETIKQAGVVAKEQVFKAEAEAQEIVKNNEKEISTTFKRAMISADSDAQKLCKIIDEVGQKKAEKIISKAEQNTPKAKSIIIGRIVSKYGNC